LYIILILRSKFFLVNMETGICKNISFIFFHPADDNSAVEIGAFSCYDIVNHPGWRLFA